MNSILIDLTEKLIEEERSNYFLYSEDTWEMDLDSKNFTVGDALHEILHNEIKTLGDWIDIIHPNYVDDFKDNLESFLKGLSPHFYCSYLIETKEGWKMIEDWGKISSYSREQSPSKLIGIKTIAA